MLADPNFQSILAGALMGGFCVFATVFARLIVKILVGALIVTLSFVGYSQGVVGLEKLFSSIVASLLYHIYFSGGFGFTLFALIALGFTNKSDP
ncbi:MAG: hypothetical protein ACRBF0_07010 [Calditrichia bacterium]